MPEFVNLDGLTCLIKVGAEADQNYQNYILRGWYLGAGHLSSPSHPQRGRLAGAEQASKFAQAASQAALGVAMLRRAGKALPLPALCLAALSQIMLFVDGMQGVINHNETVQWLYTLSGSPVRPCCPWGTACAVFSGVLPHSLPWCSGTFGCVGSCSHPSGSHPGSPELPVLM